MELGANAVIFSRKLEVLEKTAKELTSKCGGRGGGTTTRCVPVQADVRQYESVVAVMKAAVDAFGRIDILVNGAAGNFLCPAEKLSPNAYRT